LGKTTTLINIDILEDEPLCHPDRQFVDNLISSLWHEFYTGIANPPNKPFKWNKMLSASRYAGDVALLVNSK
jgi:hypothetical protein